MNKWETIGTIFEVTGILGLSVLFFTTEHERHKLALENIDLRHDIRKLELVHVDLLKDVVESIKK